MPIASFQHWRSFLDRMFCGLHRRGGRSSGRRASRPHCRPWLESLEDRLAPAVFRVPFDNGNLSAALTEGVAKSSDANNTIVLGNGTFEANNLQINVPEGKSLTIVGSGKDVTFITGNLQDRVLEIVSGNVAIRDLTIKDGNVFGVLNSREARGGGLLIDGGTVSLTDVIVRDNYVHGDAGGPGVDSGAGGAPGQTGQSAYGGGIYVTAGSLTMERCVITHNDVYGGNGGNGISGGFPASDGGVGGDAAGGGLYVKAGTAIAMDCAITNNQVWGGAGGRGANVNHGVGGAGGDASGGGFYVVAKSKMNLFGSEVTGNIAHGGAGGAGGSGAAYQYHFNVWPGDGGDGGWAKGGGGCNFGHVNLVSTTFANDMVFGGQGGAGGQGFGQTVDSSGNLLAPGERGGAGGAGGRGLGGGIFQDGILDGYGGSVSDCFAQGGQGGDGADGGNGANIPGESPAGYGGYGGYGGEGGMAAGGGIYSSGAMWIYQATLANNAVTGGDGGAGADGGNGGGGGNGPDPDGLTTFSGRWGADGGNGGGGGIGGAGGDGWGGGIASLAPLNLVSSTISNGSARGGAGGAAGNGGKGGNGGAGSNALLPPDSFGAPGGLGGWGGEGGTAGSGGVGGNAFGGGLYADDTGQLYIYAGSISGRATGGPGGASGIAGDGGNGGIGGMGVGGYYDYYHVWHVYGIASGGAGGDGGDALGAGGSALATNNGGDAKGGGVYLAPNVTQTTIGGTTIPAGPLQAGSPGANGVHGVGGDAGANYYNFFDPTDTGHGDAGSSAVATAGAVAAGADIENAAGVAIQTHQVAATAYLTFSPLPPTVFGGAKFRYPVYVVAIDSAGNVAGDFGQAGPEYDKFVDLTDDAPANDFTTEYDTLGGTPRAPLVNGVAVFTDLRDNHRGGIFRLVASSSSLNPPVPLTNTFVSDQFGLIGYTPDQIRQAYGFDKLGNDVNGHALDGTGQTIAIIVAYHNPNLLADLDAFDSYFGLTSHGPASTFVTVVNQDGDANDLPGLDPRKQGSPGGNWEQEEVLDVEWAHAMAPGAKIVVIECDPSDFLFKSADLALYAGIDYANSLADGSKSIAGVPPVTVVSMSFGRTEPPASTPFWLPDLTFETSLDAKFQVPGVTYLASTGDEGAPGVYPAFSPFVVAVGGTGLWIGPNGSYAAENGWSGSGGGLSAIEKEHGMRRSTPDVSFVGDFVTGVAVYDSYNKVASIPWGKIGGTSLSAPCWAALIAIVNQGRQAKGRPVLNSAGGAKTREGLYHFALTRYAQDYHDITTGSNGAFHAGVGLDMVTGLGTPRAEALIPDLINYDITLRITPTSVPQATVRAHYHQVITARNDIGSITLKSSIASGTTIFGLKFTIHNGDVATLTIDGTPTTKGVIHFTLQATDGAGQAVGPISYTLTINNPPLALGKLSRAAWTQNHPGYIGTIAVSDGTPSYSVQVSGLPDPAHVKWSFDPKSNLITIVGTPTVAGAFDFGVTVTDKAGDVKTGTYRLTINSPPKLGSLTPSDWTRGRPYAGTIQINGGTPRYKGSSVVITGLPPGLAWTGFDTRTGVITIKGTPTISGTYKVRVGVDDQVGAHAAAVFRFTIHAPITLGKLSRNVWTQDQSGYMGTISVGGGTGPFGPGNLAVSGLPAGIIPAIDPTTGRITFSGTPTQAIHATVNVTVTDVAGSKASGKYFLNINPPITLGVLSSTAWTEDHAYSGIIQVKGGTGPYVGGSLAVSGLPAGLGVSSFETVKGIITISGIPSAPVATPNNVIVSVQTGAPGSAIYTLVINPPVSLGPTSLPQGLVNTPYSETITASGGTGVPGISFVVVGTVPTGLAIGLSDASTLSITGTPTSSGTVIVQVAAMDAVGATARQNYVVTIAPQGGLVDAPKITSISPAAGLTSGGTTVTITGTNLLGAIGVLFGDTLVTKFASATNTTWVVTSPPGTAGTVEVRVITGIGTSDPVSFQYVPPPVFQPAALPAGAVGVAYNKTVSVSGSEIWQLSYQVIGPVPKGLKISQAVPGGTIVISGKPAAVGSFKIKVTAKDTLGVSVVHTFTVTIN